MAKMMLPLACLLLLSGCALVPGLARARESYEASQAQFAQTAEALNKAAQDLVDLKRGYDEAVAAGQMDKAAAILDTAQKAVLKYQTLKAAADESKAAYDVAKAELSKAETADQYVGTVLGLLGSIATGVLGVFAGKRKAGTALDALGLTTNAVESLKGGKPWADVKSTLLAGDPAARKLIDEVRP